MEHSRTSFPFPSPLSQWETLCSGKLCEKDGWMDEPPEALLSLRSQQSVWGPRELIMPPSKCPRQGRSFYCSESFTSSFKRSEGHGGTKDINTDRARLEFGAVSSHFGVFQREATNSRKTQLKTQWIFNTFYIILAVLV